MKLPLVSVIINCFNGEKFLNNCIKSILNQTYQNFEIVFWDNNSEDKSKEIVMNFGDNRIKYFSSKIHLTLGNARNHALDKCKGDLITFLDVDDWYLPNKLELQVKEFFNNNEVGLVFSNYFHYNNNNKKKLLTDCKKHENFITQNLIDNYNIGILTVMVKKNLIINEKFNINYNFLEDFDLVLRLSLITKFKFIENPTAYYRVHDNNLSKVKLSDYVAESKSWIETFDKNYNIDKKFVFKKFLTQVKLMEIKLKIIEGKKINALKDIIACDFDKNFVKKVKYLLSIFVPTFLIKKIYSEMF